VQQEDEMTSSLPHLLSRRHFCLCCIGGAAFAASNGWLTPRQAFAEARGLVSLIKDSAATSPRSLIACGTTSAYLRAPAETLPSSPAAMAKC